MIAGASAKNCTLHINNSVNQILKKIVNTVPEIFIIFNSIIFKTEIKKGSYLIFRGACRVKSLNWNCMRSKFFFLQLFLRMQQRSSTQIFYLLWATTHIPCAWKRLTICIFFEKGFKQKLAILIPCYQEHILSLLEPFIHVPLFLTEDLTQH